MSRRVDPVAETAEALAHAFLAGDWDPAAMARRGHRCLGQRRAWVAELARAVRAGFPEPPVARPRQLGAFIAACEPFVRAANDPRHPIYVEHQVWASSRMGTRRWPVPEIPDQAALARWAALTPDHLAWFADRRSMERTAVDEELRHYRRSWVTKRDGSARLLERPKRELKELQRQVLHEILDPIPAHDAAHGFRPGRSVRTAVAPHVGREVVIRLDLESFFTSVTAGRAYGSFLLAGYPETVAHSLAALCTTTTPRAVLATAPAGPPGRWEHRRRMLQALRRPHLAQGSPTSPALANLSAFGLDRRLTGLAERLDATYTRYADDLILSGGRALARSAPSIIDLVGRIARDEGFTVHPAKTRVATQAQRQAVTGLVLNERPNVARPEYDRLRAILHDAAVHGPAAANRDGHPDLRAHLAGRIAWVGAGSPARAARLEAAFTAITW